MNNYTVFKFWAPWCVPCQGLNKILTRESYLIDGKDIYLNSVNVDEDNGASLSAHYGVRSVPTLILVENGQERARRSGSLTLAEFEAWVSSSLM